MKFLWDWQEMFSFWSVSKSDFLENYFCFSFQLYLIALYGDDFVKSRSLRLKLLTHSNIELLKLLLDFKHSRFSLYLSIIIEKNFSLRKNQPGTFGKFNIWVFRHFLFIILYSLLTNRSRGYDCKTLFKKHAQNQEKFGYSLHDFANFSQNLVSVATRNLNLFFLKKFGIGKIL